MEIFHQFLALFSDIQGTLSAVTSNGAFTGYLFLVAIIFAETGLVFLPFLPGDSLLFAAGVFSATGVFSVAILLPLLCATAIIGDSVNYAIGRTLGKQIVKKGMVNAKHYTRAQEFSAKHGTYAIVLARFIPILRTIVPFVAGMTNMPYASFITYNVIGGIAWASGFLLLGFFFGNIPFVQAHFEIIILAIIIVSFAPLIYQALRSTKK